MQSAAYLNAFIERFIRSIKEECLDRVIPMGEAHLRELILEYMAHYHMERPHQGKRSNNGVVDSSVNIRPHRIVRKAIFPEARRQRGDVASRMMFHALQDVDQIRVRIDPLQSTGRNQALKHPNVLGPELGPAKQPVLPA